MREYLTKHSKKVSRSDAAYARSYIAAHPFLSFIIGLVSLFAAGEAHFHWLFPYASDRVDLASKDALGSIIFLVIGLYFLVSALVAILIPQSDD